MKNFIKDKWLYLEKNFPNPRRLNKLRIIDFKDLEKKILDSDKKYLDEVIESLYSGDFYILKNAFSKNFMENLKNNTFNYFKNKPSEFYKMLEGTPDFHRIIDLEIGKKYAIKSCKHSFYFYPWNSDELNLFEPIYKRWRIIKTLMGLKPREFEKNTPKDGVVDRIQVVQYPSKIGYLEPHVDPSINQRLIFSGYMSKAGEDFVGIGFYLIDKSNQIVEVETSIDVGDIGIGYATVYHGVAPVNVEKQPNWNDCNDGRWFLSMYSNDSDEKKNRITSSSLPEKFDIKEIYPQN